MAEGWSGKGTSRSSDPRTTSTAASIPCRFFKQGKCIYGDGCRYLHEQDSVSSEFTTQSQPLDGEQTLSSVQTVSKDWADAPEFVPSWCLVASQTDLKEDEEGFPPITSAIPTLPLQLSADDEAGPSVQEPQPTHVMTYARAVDPSAGLATFSVARSASELCPYYLMGFCRYGEECTYIHGEVCELCGHPCLHPTDEEQRLKHNRDCMQQHKIEMEKSFAVARSRDKACGICMETIWEKLPSAKQRFGLLPNCSHCFCLDCIRKWRQEKQFENKIIRSCPECRVQSDFVCPSRYWCETKEEKEKLIMDYKKALSKKACKYFDQGRGECPFGNRCFYQHALPDGTKADVGPPAGKMRRRRIGPDEEEVEFVRFLLWDFLEERDSRSIILLDEYGADLYDSDSDGYLSDDTETVESFLQYLSLFP